MTPVAADTMLGHVSAGPGLHAISRLTPARYAPDVAGRDSSPESTAVHVLQARSGGKIFARCLPDYRKIKAVLGATMSNMLILLGDPACMFAWGATVMGSVMWAVVEQEPMILAKILGSATVLASIGAVVWGWRIQSKTNAAELRRIDSEIRTKEADDRAKEKEAEAKERASDAIIAASNLEIERLEIEKKRLQQEALIAERALAREEARRLRMEDESTLVGQLDEVAARSQKNELRVAALEKENRLVLAARDRIQRSYIRAQAQNLVESEYLLRPDQKTIDSIPIPPVAEESDGPPPPWRTMIVVDDHEDPGQAMGGVLEGYNWHVIPVTSCAAAIEIIKGDSPPACVILNLKVPDGQGPDLIGIIEGRRGTTRVIVFAAGAKGPLAEEAARLRPDAFFPGPVEFRELLNAVGRPVEPAGPPPPVVERIEKVEVAVEDLTVTVEDLKDAVKGAEVDP
jgi:two-component system, response regulator RegA